MLKGKIVNFIILIIVLITFLKGFVNRDIYLANRLAHSEYTQWNLNENVDSNLFTGPVLTIENKNTLAFTWESKYAYSGEKLKRIIVVPRLIFSETKLLGDGPWHLWFKDGMKFDDTKSLKDSVKNKE